MTATLDNEMTDLRRANAELQRRLDERTAERDEALERETATAEVLGVINSSPGDLGPVFDAVLDKALRLCEAAFGILLTFDGTTLRTVAFRNVPEALAQYMGQPLLPDPETMLGRVVRERRTVHTEDNAEAEPYRNRAPLAVAAVELGHARTVLHVPLIRDEIVLGVVIIFRQEVRSFTDKQIALLENFATQAVIAMENARLITETRDALDQQTATSEVLQVINSSPGDLALVFEAMLEKAMRLCGAAFGSLWTNNGDRFRPMAHHGVPAPYAEYLAREVPAAGPGTGRARLLAGEPFAHIADLADEEPYRAGEPHRRALVDLGGARSALLVPLRKDEVVIGFIMIYRREVRPFSDKQIALLENFAVQAVIAMENARLINETREALEQQTATSEVLAVINSSPGDLKPVFEAMLEKAMRLCEAKLGFLSTFDGRYFDAVAMYGVPEAYATEYFAKPYMPAPGTTHARIVDGEDIVHVTDLIGEGLDSPRRRAVIEMLDARTILGVALHKDGALLGALHVYRQEVRPFTDKQIALLENFAQQAVIAMENARLITETREALEQQTATAEVLGVINSSPGDLAPVFDAMLDKAMSLCDAAFGIMNTYDAGQFRTVTLRGAPDALAEFLLNSTAPPPDRDSPPGRLISGEDVVQIEDLPKDRGARGLRGQAMVQLGGARSYVTVALRKDGHLLGSIAAYRQEVRPFTDKQIALLQNFAAQAVIAMENARLITETREALEQQTATAEVLGIINSSPGNLTPVYDAMLEKAKSLCAATFGTLWTYDGEYMHVAAIQGARQEYTDFLQQGPYVPSTIAHLPLLAGAPVVHIADLTTHEGYSSGNSVARAVVELGRVRTLLAVPLRKDAGLLGVFSIYRDEVRPFTDKQIALLQNFAAQAVIAIENTRLMSETREALEQQTATAEVLQVINSSPGNLAPVFDAMLERAVRLCEFDFSTLWTFDGSVFHPVARHGVPERFWQYLQGHTPPAFTRVLAGERLVHISDLQQVSVYMKSDFAHGLRGLGLEPPRSLLIVPMRKDEVLLGAIVAYREEVRPFSDKQIALVENFAAQAVIAMENARLITETREALEQQTATAEVLGVINASPGELEPVFDTILEKAHNLCGAAKGALMTLDGEHFRAVATRGLSKAYTQMLREPQGNPPGSPRDRLLRGEPFVQIFDLSALDLPVPRAAAKLEGARTVLFVPLRKDGVLFGYITVYRQEVRQFSEREIALLQNFAAQAVIAMENARLINETREALEQQTATAEVLEVINSSPGDLVPVFEAMLERAMRLCKATFGVLQTYDGDAWHTDAARGVPLAYAEFRKNNPPAYSHPGTGPARLLAGEHVVHILDLKEEDAYYSGDPNRRALVDIGGARTSLHVALIRDEKVCGCIQLYNSEVRPFTDKQIALLQNFAAQAVVAMANARLLDEVRQRQAELRVTFDNMADGVVMFDEELRLAAWNRNFQELLDLPDAVMADRPSYAEYLRILVERGEFGTDDIEAELSRRLENADQELRIERTRPDGRVIEVRRNAVPDGGFVLIYSDITERKRSEAEIRAARDTAQATLHDLRAAQANLIQAEKMASLGQLTAGIAHEIKNPLNFVNNFASLSVELLDELKEATASAISSLDKDKRADVTDTMELLTGNLEKIAEHGKRADNIVKSMLEHSRGVSGERREVDLNALIEEALNLAYHGVRAQNQDFNIILERDYAASLKPIEVVPQEITRVFLNLFGNGFYAANKRVHESGDGSFRSVLTVATREAEDAVEVRVRDNGTGIPAEIRDKLFQPFFTTKPTGEGTGLGLSISYDIVTQQHGGTIEVDSGVGEFTEFTVRLPRTHRATATEAAS